MTKRSVNSNKAPSAVGPYSHAVAAGGFAFLSGQIGLDPATGLLAPGGTKAQLRRALDNAAAVLAELGLSFADVVKTTVFLKDMGEFGEVNTVYGEAFGSSYPARSAVQVSALPKGASVEVEMIARLREDE